MQQQRRGFNTPYSGEDPKIHERVLGIQRSILGQLMHRSVLNRMVNSSLYGNEYSLSSYFSDLNNAIFKVDKNRSVNSFRQNLQVAYVNRLIVAAKDRSLNSLIHAQVHRQLTSLQNEMNNSRPSDASTNAHREYLSYLIESYFDK